MKLIVLTTEELEELVKTSTKQGIIEYRTQTESVPKSKHSTIKDTAERLHVSELSVRNYIKRGLIKAHKVGNRVLVDNASIDQALSEVKSLKYKR